MQNINERKVHDELKRIEQKMVTKSEIDSLISTIEIMGNPETMRQIAESMADIKKGKVKEINSAKDLLKGSRSAVEYSSL
ncbi:MAG: hypothetical protein V1743_04810 [Nanoarchaeota archaeon]